MGMQFLILGWLALELTDSPAQLGVVIALYGVPTLVFLAFGGIFADRIDRRWLLFFSRTVVMALIIVAGTLTLFQLISIWHTYAISFILGAIQGLSLPAQMAIVPDMVDEEDILSATSLNMAVFNGGRVHRLLLDGHDCAAADHSGTAAWAHDEPVAHRGGDALHRRAAVGGDRRVLGLAGVAGRRCAGNDGLRAVAGHPQADAAGAEGVAGC